MIEYLFTKDATWLDRWDQFVDENPKGSHLIVSDWLKSYQSYGFDFELSILVDGDRIVGGCGMVIPKFLFFKFYIIPHGPIYYEGYVHLIEPHLNALTKRAKSRGACCMQFSLPISSHASIAKYTYDPAITENIRRNFKVGKLFKHVYTSYGVNWVDLKGFDNAESYLEHLTTKVRRNIRMPYNKQAKAHFVTDIELIKSGYDVILENANFGGYNVRQFSEMKQTLVSLIQKNRACFIICEVEDHIKAAAFFVRTGNYYTNIMGGVFREKPDIKLGYMLQFEIIKKSFAQGFSGYNISMGGSAGVQEFKTRFGAESISFEQPHFYCILNGFQFKLFKLFDTHLKSYKRQISKFLALIKQ